MFVESFTNNGKPYLRLVRSVRVTNKAGLKVSQKQVVFNIGPLDRFDDGQPDYVNRLKRSFKAVTDTFFPRAGYMNLQSVLTNSSGSGGRRFPVLILEI